MFLVLAFAVVNVIGCRIIWFLCVDVCASFSSMSFVDNLCLEIVFLFFHSVYVMILELSRYFIFGFMNNFLYVFVWIHIILYADYIDVRNID